MDKLAAALDLDPIELRLRNALKPGDALLTGQVITGTAPVAEVIRACAEHPLPPPPGDDVLDRPGGAGLHHRCRPTCAEGSASPSGSRT